MNKYAQTASTSMPYPLREAINDPEIANDLFALKSGKASFDTPAPKAEIEWSQQEIQALSDFFEQCK